MTRDNQRNTNLLTDVKLAGASALVTTLAALLIPCSPVWGAELVLRPPVPVVRRRKMAGVSSRLLRERCN
ncbi:hypothetical protein [Sphingopyxis sp. BSNA05]|uniref:hypothetical protein n=1 Tax=Sphingopyxis sp. BSNA05 TaxID=1236614 RepID=UPI001564F97C|nr:hypothetical protein [Sphingopyxis sp. BSNA05]